MKISAIILAAGKSERMGENKLSLLYNGKTLLQYVFDLIGKMDLHECILVISSGNAKELGINKNVKLLKNVNLSGDFVQLEDVTQPIDMAHNGKLPIKVVYNKHVEMGQSYSVKLGIEEASSEGYLFMAGDQPLLTEELICDIIYHAKYDKIVFPLDGNGNPSNPTFFGGAFKNELLSLEGDVGGRYIRDKFTESCIPITTNYPEQLMDIDNQKTYKQLLDMTNIV